MRFSILCQVGTNIILTGGAHWPAIAFLNECTGDTFAVPSVNYPNYMDTSFPLTTADPSEYVHWAWSPVKRILLKTDPDLITPDTEALSRFVTVKYAAILRIMEYLSRIRIKSTSGVLLQDRVYTAKRLQAQRFKDNGYNEDSPTDYLFVVQYADLANLSLRQAADDILYKAKLSDEIIAQSERVRLIYFRRMAKAATHEEIEIILSDFMEVYNPPHITHGE